MISLISAFVVLIVGYFVYSKVAQKVFDADGRATPAYIDNDGVDCMPMKTWKAFLIQLLNIAGTGPIFGALMGAVFGPIVYLWIVMGSLFGGAIHDYMAGMISCRNHGASIADLSGKYMGKGAKYAMRVILIVLLTLVGTVFVESPATLLAYLTPSALNKTFWMIVIFVYYVLATLLPIDKIIGKCYPIFGAILLVMAFGTLGGIIFNSNYSIPEFTFENMNPNGLPVWPFMFVTVACGAISGFHATQSPMIAKCIKREKYGRPVFYGAMISEAVIALVWASAGVAFYGTTQVLNDALSTLGQAGTVYEIATGLIGKVGGVLAIIGVVVCPLTSGDTAFRSARLILAEWTGFEQKTLWKRLVLTVPLLTVSGVLMFIPYDVIWRYFSWCNQTLAMISLWVISCYLIVEGKYKYGSLLSAIPATFMSGVSLTYILMASEGFSLSAVVAYPCGLAFALACFGAYLWYFIVKRLKPKKTESVLERTENTDAVDDAVTENTDAVDDAVTENTDTVDDTVTKNTDTVA